MAEGGREARRREGRWLGVDGRGGFGGGNAMRQMDVAEVETRPEKPSSTRGGLGRRDGGG